MYFHTGTDINQLSFKSIAQVHIKLLLKSAKKVYFKYYTQNAGGIFDRSTNSLINGFEMLN